MVLAPAGVSAPAPACSPGNSNLWLTQSSCRWEEVCCLPAVAFELPSLHAHKTQHGLALFHYQTLFQILIF